MYKKLVQMIIDTNSEDDLNVTCSMIHRAFNDGKISFKDHEQLFALINKIF